METMRYTERRKSSKGFVFGFLLFVILGSVIIFLSVKSENKPVVIGKKNNNDVIDENPLVNVKDNDTIQTSNNDVIEYKVDVKKYEDKSNKKIKADIELPTIFINSEELTNINSDIYKKYTDFYLSLKETMKSVENNFTYKITYDTYENTVDGKRIVSLKIYQRVIDDESKKTTTEKIEVVNIDLETSKIIKNEDVIPSLFGIDYKTIIRACINDYIEENKIMSKDDLVYSYTGLENFYINEGNIHLIFNEDELVPKKYGVLDIVIKQDKE